MEDIVEQKSKLDFKWYIVFALILASVIVYFYKDNQLKNYKSDIKIRVDSIIVSENIKLIKAVCKPLVFATRSEMLNSRFDEINILNADLVKGNDIQSIILMDIDGNVLSSTNKKLEGSKAPASIIKYLAEDKVKVFPINDSITTVVTPVMGYNSKLGEIILNYKFNKLKQF